MALIFPSSPTNGQTYQSGSSATYQYNGQFWTVVTPPTVVFASAVSASLATSASYLATPTIYISGDLNQNNAGNTNITYATTNRLNLTSASIDFSIGNFTVGTTGITPSVSGFYEVFFTGYMLDGGGSATLAYMFIGVNGVEKAATQVFLGAGYRNTFAFREVSSVTAGQLIDIKFGAAELVTVKDSTISVRRVG